jgi:hypothetical protein
MLLMEIVKRKVEKSWGRCRLGPTTIYKRHRPHPRLDDMRDSSQMQGAELSLAPIIYVFDLHGSALRAFLGHEHIIDCFDLEGANAVRLRNGAWGLVQVANRFPDKGGCDFHGAISELDLICNEHGHIITD